MINFGTTTGGAPVYNLKLFYLDTLNDVGGLPTNCAVGSKAYIIEDSSLYMLNSEKRWIKQAFTGNIKPPSSGDGDIEWEPIQNETSLDGFIPWEEMSVSKEPDEILWEQM